jgi:hypothetical protein
MFSRRFGRSHATRARQRQNREPAADSLAGMRGVIQRAGRHHTGSFVTYHDQPLPW